MQDLPPVGDDFFSAALAVGDDRTVTGVSIGANDLRAVVWEHGEPTDLNTVISGTPGNLSVDCLQRKYKPGNHRPGCGRRRQLSRISCDSEVGQLGNVGASAPAGLFARAGSQADGVWTFRVACGDEVTNIHHFGTFSEFTSNPVACLHHQEDATH
jgi:hypothetical protein